MKKLLAFTTAFALLAGPLFAASVDGVKVPDTLTVEGKTLKLNGAGMRKMAMFRVYIGALYLENPSKDPDAIIAADEAKTMRLRMMRAVEGSKISGAIAEGFANNSGALMAALRPRLDQLAKMIPDVKEGDEILLSWVPGQGTVVNVREKKTGTIEGRDFADALFSVWLGANPVQEDLKTALTAGGGS